MKDRKTLGSGTQGLVGARSQEIQRRANQHFQFLTSCAPKFPFEVSCLELR